MVIAVIPARQWSVGTPGKNRAHFADTMLCATTITPCVWVTTDDPWLVRATHGLAQVVHRPPALEDGPVEAAIAHVLTEIDVADSDVVVVLQPSSPTQGRVRYVQAALDVLAQQPDASSVVSVVPWVGEPPQKAVFVRGGQLEIPAPQRRQDCAPAYRRDGTVYAIRASYAKAGDLYGPCPVPLLVSPQDSVTVD